MKPIVRPLNAHDRAGWASMWAQYLNFYDSAVTPEIYNLTFARLIDQTHKTQNCLVAELDSSLVGLVHFIYHPHNWQVEDVCYLQDLFVIPNKRGQGIGGTLI
ncbi:MAG: GNAT family N-acetyltransferase, partial [Oceanospirillaceae bacterium]